MVHLQVLEGLPIHGYRVLAGMVGEVRQLGGDQEFFAGMTLQGDPGRFFRPALHVHGRRIEIVYSVSYGIVHQLVDRILVDPRSPGRRAKGESASAYTRSRAATRDRPFCRWYGKSSGPVGMAVRAARPPDTGLFSGLQPAQAAVVAAAADSHDFQKLAAGQYVPVFILVAHHRLSP